MTISDLNNKTVKISRRTITVLNEQGKTAGMVTQVDALSTKTLPPRKVFDLAKQFKDVGVDMRDTDKTKWFIKDGNLFYIYDTYKKELTEKWREIDGDKPIQEFEKNLEMAKAVGAEVITVSRVYDTREV